MPDGASDRQGRPAPPRPSDASIRPMISSAFQLQLVVPRGRASCWRCAAPCTDTENRFASAPAQHEPEEAQRNQVLHRCRAGVRDPEQDPGDDGRHPDPMFAPGDRRSATAQRAEEEASEEELLGDRRDHADEHRGRRPARRCCGWRRARWAACRVPWTCSRARVDRGEDVVGDRRPATNSRDRRPQADPAKPEVTGADADRCNAAKYSAAATKPRSNSDIGDDAHGRGRMLDAGAAGAADDCDQDRPERADDKPQPRGRAVQPARGQIRVQPRRTPPSPDWDRLGFRGRRSTRRWTEARSGIAVARLGLTGSRGFRVARAHPGL